MILRRLGCILLASLFSGLFVAHAQKPLPAVSPASKGIRLNVVVDTKWGQPVTDLRRQDFVVLDNKSPRPITSFKVMTPAQEQVEVILVFDAVNIPYATVSYVRHELTKFLLAGDAKLAFPTTLAVLTDNGVMIANGFSTNGKAISGALAHHIIGLREINLYSQWSDRERQKICLAYLHELLAYAARLPGRKLFVWISPGWPLESGPQNYITPKTERIVFDNIVSLSTSLRRHNVTFYTVNPIGAGVSMMHANYYMIFLGAVTGPQNVQLGNLSLQVLSTQSGGLVFEANNDIAAMIRKCLLDAKSWYSLRFDPPPAGRPNQFHRITVKLGKPGFVVRTRNGYYANPRMVEERR